MADDLHTRILARLDEEVIGDNVANALRAVVERHKPVTFWRPWAGEPLRCEACIGPSREHLEWPCPDIRLIADQLGLTEGGDHGDR